MAIKTKILLMPALLASAFAWEGCARNYAVEGAAVGAAVGAGVGAATEGNIAVGADPQGWRLVLVPRSRRPRVSGALPVTGFPSPRGGEGIQTSCARFSSRCFFRYFMKGVPPVPTSGSLPAIEPACLLM